MSCLGPYGATALMPGCEGKDDVIISMVLIIANFPEDLCVTSNLLFLQGKSRT